MVWTDSNDARLRSGGECFRIRLDFMLRVVNCKESPLDISSTSDCSVQIFHLIHWPRTHASQSQRNKRRCPQPIRGRRINLLVEFLVLYHQNWGLVNVLMPVQCLHLFCHPICLFQILNSNAFLGKKGSRTMFNIRTDRAVDIRAFSKFPKEEERWGADLLRMFACFLACRCCFT